MSSALRPIERNINQLSPLVRDARRGKGQKRIFFPDSENTDPNFTLGELVITKGGALYRRSGPSPPEEIQQVLRRPVGYDNTVLPEQEQTRHFERTLGMGLCGWFGNFADCVQYEHADKPVEKRWGTCMEENVFSEMDRDKLETLRLWLKLKDTKEKPQKKKKRLSSKKKSLPTFQLDERDLEAERGNVGPVPDIYAGRYGRPEDEDILARPLLSLTEARDLLFDDPNVYHELDDVLKKVSEWLEQIYLMVREDETTDFYEIEYDVKKAIVRYQFYIYAMGHYQNPETGTVFDLGQIADRLSQKRSLVNLESSTQMVLQEMGRQLSNMYGSSFSLDVNNRTISPWIFDLFIKGETRVKGNDDYTRQVLELQKRMKDMPAPSYKLEEVLLQFALKLKQQLQRVVSAASYEDTQRTRSESKEATLIVDSIDLFLTEWNSERKKVVTKFCRNAPENVRDTFVVCV